MLTLELCRPKGITGGDRVRVRVGNSPFLTLEFEGKTKKQIRTLIYTSENVKNAIINQEFPLNSVCCPATCVWRLSKHGYVATADFPEVTEMGHVSKKMCPASVTLCSSQQSSGGLYQPASVCARMSSSSRRSALKLGESVCARSPFSYFSGE